MMDYDSMEHLLGQAASAYHERLPLHLVSYEETPDALNNRVRTFKMYRRAGDKSVLTALSLDSTQAALDFEEGDYASAKANALGAIADAIRLYDLIEEKLRQHEDS